MFWTILYIAFAYAVVTVLLVLLTRKWKGSKFRYRIAFAFLLFVPISPYLVVAGQTTLFAIYLRPYVKQALLDTGMSSGNFTVMRIFWITPFQATIYVEEPCTSWPKPNSTDRDASLLYLQRRAGGWRLVQWDSVWSDCGSAGGNTFPPYPNAKEF